MSTKDEETNANCQLSMGNGTDENVNNLPNKCAFASVMAASTISTIYGYVVGVMAGALVFIKEDLQINDLKVQLLAGMLNLCALPACMIAGRVSDYKGRRGTIILASITLLLGSILTSYGPSYPILMTGNCITGIGSGFALIIAPVYSAEISPPSYRGFLTSLPEFSINIGLLLGYLSNYFFEKLTLKLGWRLMLAVPALPSFAVAILMLKLVESPRWLVMQGRVNDAKKVLLLVSNTSQEAEQRLKEIKSVVGIDENCTQDIVHVPKKTSSGGGALKELFLKPSPSLRRILIASIGVHLFLQIGGFGALLLYGPRIFEKTGIINKSKLMLANAGIGVTKVVFGFMSIFLLDKVGRRILLLVSSFGMVVSLLGLGICFTIVESSKEKVLVWAISLTIVLTYMYMAFFTIGVGPVTWVYSSEILPLRFRAQGLGVCVAVNRITNVVMVTSFISIYKVITMGGIFFMFTAINALAWFFYYFLPETKGRPLEDIETIFENSSKLEMPVKAGCNK